MTRGQKLEYLRMMIDSEDDSDGILGLYLDMAGDKILNRMYPFLEDYSGKEVPERYAMIQLNVAAYLMNKRGAEGQVQHIENNIHRNFGSADVPGEMLKDILPMAMAIR